MKKSLLLLLSMAVCMSVMAQVAEHFPDGFRRAKVPAALNHPVLKPLKKAIDNQVPGGGIANSGVPLRQVAAVPPSYEEIIGYTFYDLQTNNSISNRLILNDDGTICAAWTFSPNAISTTNPPFPARGSGYNYWDGTAWSYPSGPVAKQESSNPNVRTGFTNIVVTPTHEMLIAHGAVGTSDSNQIAVTRRTGRGTGAWDATVYPWGHAFDTWPKAVAAGNSGTNENVYVVFQGSGAGTTTTHTPGGQNGPLYFSKSTDGGLTWSPKWINPLIDSTHYSGFGGDSYSIDAKGDTIAISIGDTYTDVLLLKSNDSGATWTKRIIQRHPIPFYATCNCGTFYLPDPQDTTVDTVFSNAGDTKVLLDNNGMAHVWFSRFDYMDDDSTDNLYLPFDASDDLFYWNEDMDEDTVGGHRAYVSIATAQDFNGNGFIDVPSDTFTTCANRNPWGEYAGGITQMPSAGVDETGRLYVSYQTIDEAADTTFYHAAHRHVYMKTLAPDGLGHYDPANWTYPFDIVPSIASGGDGENQEAVFACTATRVDSNYAYVLYQRDGAPGHGLAADGTCDKAQNLGNSSDIVLARVSLQDANGIKTTFAPSLFVSQNYPNPSTGLTYINLGLKKSGTVKMEVHDLIGKVVYQESFGTMASGTNTISLNTSTWDQGAYTYTITAGGEKSTRRMIVQ